MYVNLTTRRLRVGIRGHDEIGPSNATKYRRRRVKGDRTACLESNQTKHRHEALADLQVVEPIDDPSRAAPAEIVDPVVAIRCDAKLT